MSRQHSKLSVEPPPTRDPSALILRIGDTLGSHADEIDNLYRAYTTSIWIVASLEFILTIFFVAIWTSLPLTTQVIYGVLNIVLIGWIVRAIWAQKGFELVDDIEWEVDRFRFITTLELLPPRGDNPQQRLWNSLKQASQIAEELNNLPTNSIMFNVEVSGKSRKQYLLDIFVRQEARSRLLRFLAKWTLRVTYTHRIYYYLFPRFHHTLHEAQTTILVKRLAKETPVTKSDLEELKNAFEDISKKLRDIPEHTIVVSTSGFTEDAIDYLKDEKSEIKPFDDKEESTVLDLIVEKRDGSYEVAYYG